jgi:hypothetical protein
MLLYAVFDPLMPEVKKNAMENRLSLNGQAK